MPRGDVMQRAFQIIRLINSGPITVRIVMDKLDVSKFCAKRWIEQVSRFYPVYESGLDYSGGGRPGIVYELLGGQISCGDMVLVEIADDSLRENEVEMT